MVHPELTLSVEEGELAGLVCRSGRKKRVTVGRTRANVFQIKESTVSQKHALIEWKGEQWVLQDVGSSNGTFHNGVMLEVNVPVGLTTGDVVSVGPDIVAVVTVEGEGAEQVQPSRQGSRVQEVRVPEATEARAPEGEGVQAEERKAGKVVDARGMTLAEWLDSERERRRERLMAGVQATIQEMKTYARELQVELCEYAGLDLEDLAWVL